MDERSIPIIILVVNLLFGLAILAVPSFLLFGSLWSILSMIAIIVVAGFVLEDGKKIEFIEEHYLSKITRLEESLKASYSHISELEERIEILEKSRIEQD